MSESFSPLAPADVDFFYFDFTALLASKSPQDSLTGNPSVTGAPAGLTIGQPIIVGAMVGVQIGGNGVAVGQSFVMTCEVQTTQGRTLSRQAFLPITPAAVQ